MSQAEPLLGKQDLKVSVKQQAHDIRGVTLSLTLRTLFAGSFLVEGLFYSPCNSLNEPCANDEGAALSGYGRVRPLLLNTA